MWGVSLRFRIMSKTLSFNVTFSTLSWAACVGSTRYLSESLFAAFFGEHLLTYSAFRHVGFAFIARRGGDGSKPVGVGAAHSCWTAARPTKRKGATKGRNGCARARRRSHVYQLFPTDDAWESSGCHWCPSLWLRYVYLLHPNRHISLKAIKDYLSRVFF